MFRVPTAGIIVVEQRQHVIYQTTHCINGVVVRWCKQRSISDFECRIVQKVVDADKEGLKYVDDRTVSLFHVMLPL